MVTVAERDAFFASCEHSENLPSISLIEQVSCELYMHFGVELRGYLLNYGYLAKDCVELYGLNSRQGLNSDLVTVTKGLWVSASWTIGRVAMCNLADSLYMMCDGSDRVCFADLRRPGIQRSNYGLLEYIYMMLSSLDGK